MENPELAEMVYLLRSTYKSRYLRWQVNAKVELFSFEYRILKMLCRTPALINGR